MANFNIVMPKLGESVQEATITKWFKKVGDRIKEDDSLLEIATDKVDSEIPSPVDGKIVKILYEENALVAVGEVIAIIDLNSDDSLSAESIEKKSTNTADKKEEKTQALSETVSSSTKEYSQSKRFYSPLVKNIAESEGIALNELENIQGSGINGRVSKQDIQSYIKNRGNKPEIKTPPAAINSATAKPQSTIPVYPGDEIVQMDRMRQLIAKNMVLSKQTSAHVTTFIGKA